MMKCPVHVERRQSTGFSHSREMNVFKEVKGDNRKQVLSESMRSICNQEQENYKEKETSTCGKQTQINADSLQQPPLVASAHQTLA